MNATRCSLLCLLLGALGCRDAPARGGVNGKRPAEAAPPWTADAREPTPPRGMVWIGEGPLIAGTPPDRVPRIADEELPGEQLVLHGFFVDIFPYPNEEGAIPVTGVTRSRAEGLCKEQGKRLCSELEWERACKGPRNLSYEYGDRYRPDVCLTGRAPRLLPNAYRAGCRSEFGVRDLHGGVWEWTSSRWARGKNGDLATVRGGNSNAGELVGRCANGAPKSPESSSSELGFRCCSGELNEAHVSLRLETGPVLEARPRVEGSVATELEAFLPPDVRQTLAGYGAFRFTGVWDWRPLANVPLVVGGGCAGEGKSGRCGVIVAALSPASTQLLGWIWVGIFPPRVHPSRADARRLWVYGGDRKSTFRQAVAYEWGRVRAAELERRGGADAE
jgi:sulfatase modifying factor 1